MEVLKMKDMEVIYKHPKTLIDINTHYCPGCTHGIAHRLIAEVIDEMHTAISILILSVQRMAARLPWPLELNASGRTGLSLPIRVMAI
jgi:hypothetical protein